jgi:hypothetical protein
VNNVRFFSFLLFISILHFVDVMAPDGKWGTAMAVLGFKPKSKRKISDPIPQGDVFSVNASQLCVMNKQPRPVQVSTQFRSSTTSTLNNINHRTPTSSSSFSGSYMPMTPPTPTSFDFSGASLDPVTMAAHLAQARLATLVSDDEDRVAQHKKLSKECLNAHLAASMTMMDDVVVRVTPQTITQSKRTLESIRDGFCEYADSLGKEAQRLEMDTASCSKSLSETLLITYPAKAFASSKKSPSGIFVDNQVDLLPPSCGKSENPKPSMLQLDTPQYHPGQNIEDPYAGLEPKVLKQQIIGSFDNNSVALHRKTSHSPGQTNCSISGKEDPKALEQQSSAFFVKDSAASQLRTINDSLPTITSDPNKEVETLKPQSWQQEISHFSSSSTYSVRESGDPYQELSDSIKAPDDSKPTTAGTSSYSTPMIKSTVASAIGLKKDPFEDFDPEFITALGLTDIIPIDGRLIPRSRPLNPVADDFVVSGQSININYVSCPLI